jgi:hypothetical protein
MQILVNLMLRQSHLQILAPSPQLTLTPTFFPVKQKDLRPVKVGGFKLRPFDDGIAMRSQGKYTFRQAVRQ